MDSVAFTFEAEVYAFYRQKRYDTKSLFAANALEPKKMVDHLNQLKAIPLIRRA